MRKILFAALLIQTLAFSACNDEEDPGTFKVTMNDIEHRVSIATAWLTVSENANGIGYHALRIIGVMGEDSLRVIVSNWEFQEPPANAIHVKDYYNVDTPGELEVGEETETCKQVSENQRVCEGVVVEYKSDGELFSSYSQEPEVVILSISKCSGKRVSGTFSIALQNPHNEEEVIVVSGVFEDVRYTVKRD